MLVISCMTDRDNIGLCTYMKGCKVPTLVVCDSNEDARELYAAGCTYCVQQVGSCPANARKRARTRAHSHVHVRKQKHSKAHGVLTGAYS